MDPIVQIYVDLITKSKKTLDDLPEKTEKQKAIKKAVKEALVNTTTTEEDSE